MKEHEHEWDEEVEAVEKGLDRTRVAEVAKAKKERMKQRAL